MRKEKDKEHLARSSAGGATIKLADLVDNCVSIAAHDKVLKHGDKRLWELARNTLAAAREQLR